MEIKVFKVACPKVPGNDSGYYISETLPEGCKEFVVGKESAVEPVVEITKADVQPVIDSTIDAMADDELRAYLTSKGIGFHHKTGHARLVEMAKNA